MREKPLHTLDAVRAMLADLESPPAHDTPAWIAVARESALRGNCPWCGGDGRCVLIVGQEPARSMLGCPACYGTGREGDSARRMLSGYLSPLGTGILGLMLTFAAEVEAENALRRAVERACPGARVKVSRSPVFVMVESPLETHEDVTVGTSAVWNGETYVDALKAAAKALAGRAAGT